MIKRSITWNNLIIIFLYAPLITIASPWSDAIQPSTGPVHVIGGNANGCIGGAQALPVSGIGYFSGRRNRNRYYGHPDLINFINDLGRAQQKHDGRIVLIGDLSQPRGGLMSSAHRSHQNGLDVDIWLTLADSSTQAKSLLNQKDDLPSMVKGDGATMSAAWGSAQQFLLETAARYSTVERIFVNPAIKRELCRITSDHSWLRKIRPWWGHNAHMHVRLKCPIGSLDCVNQEPLPAGDGCGAELNWWFTAEARAPKSDKSKKETIVKTPAACQKILNDKNLMNF